MADKIKPVGSSFWHVAGERGVGLIAILVTIKEVINKFSDDPRDSSYWVDEPIGHDIHCRDTQTKQEALEELLACYYDELEDQGSQWDGKIADAPSDVQLSVFRAQKMKSITKTYTDIDLKHRPKFPEYPEKEFGEEWFNVEWAKNEQRVSNNL